ncbi:hypothetical protein PT974_03773 [Cladobotryum mycophilum]|uniref:Uncharacterized protein n=1 Tax=Cladobotryum mycophilum TaxID=491253 RepID=A0ABR0STC6_9HYPO
MCSGFGKTLKNMQDLVVGMPATKDDDSALHPRNKPLPSKVT